MCEGLTGVSRVRLFFELLVVGSFSDSFGCPVSSTVALLVLLFVLVSIDFFMSEGIEVLIVPMRIHRLIRKPLLVLCLYLHLLVNRGLLFLYLREHVPMNDSLLRNLDFVHL